MGFWRGVGRVVTSPARAVRAGERKALKAIAVHAVRQILAPKGAQQGAVVKNWKTTIGGLFAALGTAGILSAAGLSPNFDKALTTAGIAILGMSSKDHDVTGGEREQ